VKMKQNRVEDGHTWARQRATRGPTGTTRLAFVSTSNQVHRFFKKKKSDPPDAVGSDPDGRRPPGVRSPNAQHRRQSPLPSVSSHHRLTSSGLSAYLTLSSTYGVYKTELRGVYTNRNLKLKQTTRKLARR
jgi:hypothetical protein